MAESAPPSRRAALQRLGAGVGALTLWPLLSEQATLAFGRIQAAQAAPSLAFLTPAQYAALDVIVETIIPTDAHSPGARAARVADYIDLLLSESDSAAQRTWTDGLAVLDASSRALFDRPTADLTPGQAAALLTEASRHEDHPETAVERFFKETKDAAIRGYYTSEIGIHQDLNYQGNRYLAEFTGCTHPEHGYEPPRG